MRRRKFLCWRCGCPGRLHVLCRICIYILVICRMRHDFFDLRHDRLQRWVRLCRRLVAARPMHVQCWIRIDFNRDIRVFGWQQHVPANWLRRGIRVRGRLGAASRLYLQRRLRIYYNCNNRVRDKYWYLLDDRV